MSSSVSVDHIAKYSESKGRSDESIESEPTNPDVESQLTEETFKVDEIDSENSNVSMGYSPSDREDIGTINQPKQSSRKNTDEESQTAEEGLKEYNADSENTASSNSTDDDSQGSEIVTDSTPPKSAAATTHGKSPTRLQQMYLTQDWWTLWIGLLSFILAVAITFIVPLEGGGSSRIKYIVPQPMRWNSNPLEAWDLYSIVGTILMLGMFLGFYLLSLVAMGKLTITNPGKAYAKGFVALCVVAIIAFWIGTQSWCKKNGLGYAIWSIIIGMIIGNSPLTSGDRLKNVKLTAKYGEYFIKCSLVLLAVEFSILGELGLPAIAVAWGASPITLVSSYLIGTRLFKMKTIPALLMATGATWCGASAISAIAAVVNAPNNETVVCIGIVAAGTVIFTFAQPYFALLVGMDHSVAGAWIGGSIDQTGNVIASAAIISDEATEIAGIVKIILNSGLGILATLVALWWQTRASEGQKKEFSWLFLWDKFPKFVLGYFICSGILTIIIGQGIPEGEALQFAVHSMSRWWFSIAFVALGISTNLKELYKNSKSTGVIKLYLVSNSIDIVLSFFAAWIFFG